MVIAAGTKDCGKIKGGDRDLIASLKHRRANRKRVGNRLSALTPRNDRRRRQQR